MGRFMSGYYIASQMVKDLWDELSENDFLNEDSEDGTNYNGDDHFASILETHLKKAYDDGFKKGFESSC